MTIGGIGVSVGLDNKLRVWETSNGILRVRFNIDLNHYLRELIVKNVISERPERTLNGRILLSILSFGRSHSKRWFRHAVKDLVSDYWRVCPHFNWTQVRHFGHRYRREGQKYNFCFKRWNGKALEFGTQTMRRKSDSIRIRLYYIIIKTIN